MFYEQLTHKPKRIYLRLSKSDILTKRFFFDLIYLQIKSIYILYLKYCRFWLIGLVFYIYWRYHFFFEKPELIIFPDFDQNTYYLDPIIYIIQYFSVWNVAKVFSSLMLNWVPELRMLITIIAVIHWLRFSLVPLNLLLMVWKIYSLFINSENILI